VVATDYGPDGGWIDPMTGYGDGASQTPGREPDGSICRESPTGRT
jgi:hypothetical protein